jgi:hypothetical protein
LEREKETGEGGDPGGFIGEGVLEKGFGLQAVSAIGRLGEKPCLRGALAEGGRRS